MRIGVTGIYASGKGTVCEMFEELGAIMVDTDIVAREIVQVGSEGLRQLVAEFGEDILNEDGTLDRRGFAQVVFKDDDSVDRLNAITHPLILNLVLEATQGEDIFVINTPLLFETDFHKKMDKTVVIAADESQVITRGIKRDNISEEEIKDRLKFQFPLNKKLTLADFSIDNSASLEATKRQVNDLWKILSKTATT